jgi:CheY-like chemotaxis protein
MDCQMPFMDGYEATHKIREIFYKGGAKQPIICAVTGHTESQYVQMAFKSGMN